MSERQEHLGTVAAKLGIGSYKRHVLLCTGPNCCTPEDGLKAWEVLKAQIKEYNLGTGEQACYRTKVGCLRICVHGPTMVVYPEGTWYHGMTADKIPRFVRQHLVEGKPVAEWVFAHNQLPNPSAEKTNE
jgi:(2Fe-2S) ferredoxin